MPAILGAALSLAASWSLGRWLLRRFDLPPALHFAAGTALLSLSVFLLLSVHAAKPAVLIMLSVVCLAPLLRYPPAALSIERPPAWTVVFLAAYGLLYLCHALSPEIQSDALHYHLAIPVSAQATGAFPNRTAFYDLIPQGLETLFAIAYAAGGESAPKLVHLTFLAATIPLVLDIATALTIPSYAAWAAALFYAVTPVTGISATCAYNDAAVTFFTLAVFLLLTLWYQRSDDRLLWPIGLCSGFCYALKFTGALIAPIALLAVLFKRRNAAALRIPVAALFIAAPWILRAAILTGNPAAPLLNQYFPNPYFHIETEQKLVEFLRSYGGTPLSRIPIELTLYGGALQGLLGPAALALPFGILSALLSRRRSGRVLLLAAAVAAIPWILNIGTRFLMPALPFLALACMASLPRPAAIALLAIHSITSWPAVIALYAPPGFWALHREIPWRAALHLDDPQAFRLAMSVEQNIAALLHQHTQPGDRILDLAGIPAAITRRDVVSYWQSALGDRLSHQLGDAFHSADGLITEWRSQFPTRNLSAVRVRFASEQTEPAALQEIQLRDSHSAPLTPNILWSITAWPNIWETPLAIDRNPVTSWSTWQRVERGMFFEIDLSGPQPIAEVRILGHKSAANLVLELYGRDGQTWSPLPLPAKPTPQPALNFRPVATRAARREGVTHIFAATDPNTPGSIASDMERNPGDWNLEPVASYETFTLYHIR